MAPDYRKIMPAPFRQAGVGAASTSLIGKKKRVQVRVACNRCRTKKISCDGNRPICRRCSECGERCIYEGDNRKDTRPTIIERQLARLQDQLQQHQDVIQHLQTAPEDEALMTIRRLKSTPNLQAVLSSIKYSMAPKRPSDIETSRATLPLTQSGLEFELAVLHDNAYPALSDIDTSAIDVSSIFKPRTNRVIPYISTNALLENYEILTMKPKPSGCIPTERLVCGPPSPLRGISSRSNSAVSGPLQRRIYCDPRLGQVRFQYWTRVPLSDEYAASLLSVYFENEHAIVGTFDIDTFLDDLVDGRLDFCSSFLVSALLSLASFNFSSLDSRAASLATAFLGEAESLWQAERSSDSVINVAAMITLAVVTMMQGKEDTSRELFADGRYMAARMCLMGVRHTSELSQKFRQLPPKRLRACAHVAWGCYNWLSVHATYYEGEPIAFPPVLPIPGFPSSVSSGGWDGHPQPEYLGQTFAEWCKLWTIAQEIQSVYYKRDPAGLHNTIPCGFAESKYQKLLGWIDHLNQGMTRKDQKFPHVSVLHAYFHITVLDLFRPLLEANEHMGLKSFSSQDSSPKAVFDASMRQLQRILLDYATTYDPRLYNFVLNGAVLHVIHSTLQNRDTLGWHFNLVLGMGWMKEIFARFAIIGKVAQAYMAMGMGSGMVSNGEARAFMEDLQSRARHHNLDDVSALCVVDFEAAMSSKDNGRAQDLAERFDEMALFNEFTVS